MGYAKAGLEKIKIVTLIMKIELMNREPWSPGKFKVRNGAKDLREKGKLPSGKFASYTNALCE